MTYKVNGTEIVIQPTSGKWIARETVGINGFGAAVYSGVRSFQLEWQLATPEMVSQVLSFFGTVGNGTGTVVMDLPKFGGTPYQFESYTGVVLREPNQGEYFSEHISDVDLLVTNIRT